MDTKFILLSCALLLGGCESAPVGWRPGPYVRPGLVMVPADQARHYGLGLTNAEQAETPPPSGYSATNLRSVQTESPVSALQFNRYPDPARPDELLHEAHIVYRRENPPRWRLQPVSAEQQILIGPRLTDGRGEIKPVASQELDSYLQEQHANLQRQQEVMAKVTQGLQQLADQQEQLAREVARWQRAGGAHAPTETVAPTDAVPEPENPAPQKRPDRE